MLTTVSGRNVPNRISVMWLKAHIHLCRATRWPWSEEMGGDYLKEERVFIGKEGRCQGAVSRKMTLGSFQTLSPPCVSLFFSLPKTFQLTLIFWDKFLAFFFTLVYLLGWIFVCL